jgi:hypothetical protein
MLRAAGGLINTGAAPFFARFHPAIAAGDNCVRCSHKTACNG